MKSIEKYLNQDWIEGIRDSKQLIIEELFFESKSIFVRMTLSNDYLNQEYSVTSTYKSYRVESKHLPKSKYYSYHDANNSIDHFVDVVEQFINNPKGKKVYVKELAPHGDRPIWDVAQFIKFGSKIIIVHSRNYDFEKIYGESYKPPRIVSSNKKDNEVIKKEFGINLDYSHLNGCVVLILPYSSACLKSWKVISDSEGEDEGLRFWIEFDQFLHPFPEFRVECQFRGKQEGLFYSKNIKIHDDSKLVYDVFPPLSKRQEIYHVSLKLFKDDILIDDYPGYPLKSINVNISVTD